MNRFSTLGPVNLVVIHVNCLFEDLFLPSASIQDDNGIPAEEVDIGALELPGGHFVVEEDVQLSVCAAFWLRKAEVDPDATQEAETSVEEPRVCSPVPRRWRKHLICQYVYRDTV
jgi:hypothetical protein